MSSNYEDQQNSDLKLSSKNSSNYGNKRLSKLVQSQLINNKSDIKNQEEEQPQYQICSQNSLQSLAQQQQVQSNQQYSQNFQNYSQSLLNSKLKSRDFKSQLKESQHSPPHPAPIVQKSTTLHKNWQFICSVREQEILNLKKQNNKLVLRNKSLQAQNQSMSIVIDKYKHQLQINQQKIIKSHQHYFDKRTPSTQWNKQNKKNRQEDHSKTIKNFNQKKNKKPQWDCTSKVPLPKAPFQKTEKIKILNEGDDKDLSSLNAKIMGLQADIIDLQKRLFNSNSQLIKLQLTHRETIRQVQSIDFLNSDLQKLRGKLLEKQKEIKEFQKLNLQKDMEKLRLKKQLDALRSSIKYHISQEQQLCELKRQNSQLEQSLKQLNHKLNEFIKNRES